MTKRTRRTNETIIIMAIRLFGMLMMLVMFLAISLLSGCQKEKIEIKGPPADEVITLNSPLVDLVSRVTMKDGSSDNLIDSASCISFLFPMTVIVNNVELVIKSEADLKLIKDIFDDDEDDDNELKIVFPVTIVLADHSKVTVDSEDELEDLIDDCTEDGDDDIECIDFKYPLSLSIYNSVTQTSDVITIASDEALYQFFDRLEDGELVSITFPVVMVLHNGEHVTVINNDEMEDIIEDVADDCDEDDEIDDDDETDIELIEILTQGEWVITYFFDETLQTALFNTFTLTFKTDGSVSATNGIVTIKGTWEVESENGITYLDLDFESGTVFHDVDKDWMVVKKSDARVELEDSSGGDEVKLVIEKK